MKKTHAYLSKIRYRPNNCKFGKTWLMIVELDELTMTGSGEVIEPCDPLENCDDSNCVGGFQDGYEHSYAGAYPAWLSSLPWDCAAAGWELCCPCGTYLGTENAFHMPACCDSYSIKIAGPYATNVCPDDTYGFAWCNPCNKGGEGSECFELGTITPC